MRMALVLIPPKDMRAKGQAAIEDDLGQFAAGEPEICDYGRSCRETRSRYIRLPNNVERKLSW